MEIALKIFTLNCWGIPLVSKDRTERIEAIAEYLSKGEHNIVCLQEVWSEDDFLIIRNRVKNVLPYSHFYFSGVSGSGLCIFSHWLIEDVFFHKWQLNGYVHMIHHGDWFGGKGVGLCRIRCNDRLIYVYCTHLHAEYHSDDMYLPHRILQAFDTAQFIRLTAGSADVVILAGDLNVEPGNVTYRLLSDLPMLYDPRVNNKLEVGTSDSSRNSYSVPANVALDPKGKAIDHIMYRTTDNIKARVTRYGFPLPERIEGKTFSYSDHEALCLDLNITTEGSTLKNREPELLRSTLDESLTILISAKDVVNHHKRRFYLLSFCSVVLLLSTVGIWDGSYTMVLFRLSVSGLLFYSLAMGVLWCRMELNGLKSTICGVETYLNNLSNGQQGEVKKSVDN